MELSFCRRLPKLELHAHLNGSISEDTVKELYDHQKKNNPSLVRGWDTTDLFQNSYSLASFFALFKMSYVLTSTPELMEMATERVIEDFAKDNVIYLELRSTLREEEHMTKREYLEAMIRGVFNCREKFPNICVKLIISMNRSESVENAEENVRLAIEYHRKYPDLIVGFDMSGNPAFRNFCEFAEVLEMARAKGLKITIHCAEVVGNDEVQEILQFHPERIGHGTCIHEALGGDENNWNLLLRKKIPVELALTSNIKCHTVSSIQSHQFKYLYAAKHPLTLVTDDKGAFKTSLSEEFELAQKAFHLSEEELWRLSYNSINYIFGDDKEKESLRVLLKQWKIGNF